MFPFGVTRGQATLAFLLGMGAAALVSAVHNQHVREYRRVGGRGPTSTRAFFEAFPQSGAGTFGPCSTTAPVGAKGEVMTFTRSSSATCTKTATGGLATTGIANGDLVVLTNNQPRVEYDANGTLGLLVEAARTNSALRSEAIDNAVWLQQNNTSAPVVTANAGVAPDGATTAERIQFPATTAAGAQYSLVYQPDGCARSSVVSGSWYVKGFSGSGTIDVVVYSGGGYFTAACAYVASSWSRCSLPNITTVAAATQISIGNGSSINGGVDRSANDVLVWGAQCEVGAFSTSYTPTAGAAATRAVEVAYFDLGANYTLRSLALSYYAPTTTVWSGTTTGAGSLVDAITSLSPNIGVIGTGGKAGCYANGVGYATSAGGPYSADRIACYIDAALDLNVITQGGAGSTAGTAAGATRAVMIGHWNNGANTPLNGIVSRVCVDPSAGRCR